MFQPTVIFIVAVLALIIAYDLWAITRHGYRATISYTLLLSSQTRPIIAFAIGVVCGHLFWVNAP